MRYHVTQSSLAGSITVTTSKSHTMRAILLASLSKGTSQIRYPLPSPDSYAMIAACSAFGVTIKEQGDILQIESTGSKLGVPHQVIDAGNSGQVLRFCAAMAATIPLYTIITGDESVRSIRPMQSLLDGLAQLGAFAVSSKGDGHAPIIIKGPVSPGHVVLDGEDSQPVSAMLMLAAFLPGVTTIEVRKPGEQPWIDLTLHWLDKLNVSYTNDRYHTYTVQGPITPTGFDYTVPGDWSSAAFPLAAALTTNSTLTLENMDIHDPQGDKAILGMFERMGARITVNENAKTIMVLPHEGLRGIDVDVNAAIDAVPVLAAVACFASSPTRITGAAIARRKESDRIAAIRMELSKMGAHIDEFDDGLVVHPAMLRGAATHSRHDHRIAMALAVAGMACPGETLIDDTACVAKSFPGFATAMRSIGAAITESA